MQSLSLYYKQVIKSNQIKFICSNISQINIGNSKSIHEQGNKAENSTNSDPKTVG